LSTAFAVTARAFRAAIRKHDFPDPCRRITETILFYSYDVGRYEALIPTQNLFGVLNERISKGRLSSSLSYLEDMLVLERRIIPVSYGGRRRLWTAYRLLPPGNWKVPDRVAESVLLRDMEEWLNNLDPDQPELLEPPVSLNALLCEDFVERSASSGTLNEGQSRVERLRPERPSSQVQSGSPGGNFGTVESKGVCHSQTPMVPPQGTKVEPQAAETSRSSAEVPPAGIFPATGSPTGNSTVPSQGTCQVPPQGTSGGKGGFDSNRSTRFEKGSTSIRVEYIDSNSSTDAREAKVPSQGTKGWLVNGYVREKLAKNPGLSMELVDGRNSKGNRSSLGWLFGELYEKDPDEAKELLSTAITRDHPNAWLNTSLRVALGMQSRPEPRADWRPGQGAL
jgi:hypothetical protein